MSLQEEEIGTHRDARAGAHAQRKGRMKAQQDGSHLQAKERGPRRNQTFQHLDLDCWPLEL